VCARKKKSSEFFVFSFKTGSKSKKHVLEKITMEHPSAEEDLYAAVVPPVTQELVSDEDDNPPDSSVLIPTSDSDSITTSKKVRFLDDVVDGSVDGSDSKLID